MGDGFMSAFWFFVVLAFFAGSCSTCAVQKGCAAYNVKIERRK